MTGVVARGVWSGVAGKRKGKGKHTNVCCEVRQNIFFSRICSRERRNEFLTVYSLIVGCFQISWTMTATALISMAALKPDELANALFASGVSLYGEFHEHPITNKKIK